MGPLNPGGELLPTTVFFVLSQCCVRDQYYQVLVRLSKPTESETNVLRVPVKRIQVLIHESSCPDIRYFFILENMKSANLEPYFCPAFRTLGE